MIAYSKTAADTNHRIRDLAWLHGRFFAIAAICVLPVCAYFFLAGIASKAPAAIKMGIQTLTLAAVLLAIYCILRSKLKKAVITNFEEYEMDGKIDFTIERIDEDTLEFTRLTDEENFEIQSEDLDVESIVNKLDLQIPLEEIAAEENISMNSLFKCIDYLREQKVNIDTTFYGDSLNFYSANENCFEINSFDEL